MKACKHKLGLLSLRECREPAVVTCSQCDRPVCKEHYKQFEDENLCIECYLQRISEQEAQRNGLDQEYRRQSYYHNQGYSPYHDSYRDHTSYREEDYRAFDRPEQAEEDWLTEDIAPADFQDS